MVGGKEDAEELASFMEETGKGPDFISLDGAEGGSGATYQDLADSVGLPLKSARMLLDDALKKHGVRDEVKLIASGKITTQTIALQVLQRLIRICREDLS